MTERKQLEGELLKYQKQLQSLSSELFFAEERERRRIATELHDRLGQNLALCKMKLGVLRKTGLPAAHVAVFRDIDRLVGQTIQDTRSFIFEISPPILYELGFEAAVEWLAEQALKQYGFLCELENDQQPKPMEEDIGVVLFQAVREFFLNIRKHAQAKHAKVTLGKEGEHIRICVEDDGVGFDPSDIGCSSSGIGLFSIRERLSLFGGTLEIQTNPGQGTRVIVTAPLKSGKKESPSITKDSVGRPPQDLPGRSALFASQPSGPKGGGEARRGSLILNRGDGTLLRTHWMRNTLRFENLNERGWINKGVLDPPLFRFEYTNNFYGSCSFAARITHRANNSLVLDESFITLEGRDIKNGDSAAILGIAKTFFNRALSRCNSLGQMKDMKTGFWNQIRSGFGMRLRNSPVVQPLSISWSWIMAKFSEFTREVSIRALVNVWKRKHG